MDSRRAARIAAGLVAAATCTGAAAASAGASTKPKPVKATSPIQERGINCGEPNPALHDAGKVLLTRIGNQVTMKVKMQHGPRNDKVEALLVGRSGGNCEGLPGVTALKFTTNRGGTGGGTLTVEVPAASGEFFVEFGTFVAFDSWQSAAVPLP